MNDSTPIKRPEEFDARFGLEQFIWFHALTVAGQKQLVEHVARECSDRHASLVAAADIKDKNRLRWFIATVCDLLGEISRAKHDAEAGKAVVLTSVFKRAKEVEDAANRFEVGAPQVARQIETGDPPEHPCPECSTAMVTQPLPAFGRVWKCLNCGRLDDMPALTHPCHVCSASAVRLISQDIGHGKIVRTFKCKKCSNQYTTTETGP